MSKYVYIFTITKKIKMIAILCVVFLIVIFLFRQRDSLFTLGKNVVERNKQVDSKIAIIIDDFGNDQYGVEEMINLPIPITCAIMPFQKNARENAEEAYQMGHEVIIHLPMEPHYGDPSWLGENAITAQLSTDQIKTIIKEAISIVPHAVGVNNHMGSKATEDQRIIKAIVEVLKEKNLYIVDSKTTMKSVVPQTAKDLEVQVYVRNIFLDNVKNSAAIKAQLRELAEIALAEGSAIGIGHVGPEGGLMTAGAIEEMKKEIEDMGIVFVKISDLEN